MKHYINDMKRRALHNADAAYYVGSYLQHSFPVMAKAICHPVPSSAMVSR